MPIYEFKCKKCGATFEKLVFASDNPNIVCDSCGSKDVSKLFSSFGFASKGKAGGSSACGSCSSSNCSTCGK